MKTPEAYVFFRSGTYYTYTYPGQKLICQSIHYRRAVKKAQKAGYSVMVHSEYGSPKGAERVTWGLYRFPAVQ